MARIKTLDSLKKEAGKELVLGSLPEKIQIYDFALEKGYQINEIVRRSFGKSYEWYGFLLCEKDKPEVVVDLGIGDHECNMEDYVRISPENTGEIMDSLPQKFMINGWIHSHGDTNYRRFSDTDYGNMETVLGFVSSATKRPLSKRETRVNDLSLLVEGHSEEALETGNITAVTDSPVGSLKLFEKVYGSFSYSIVIGDQGWHRQCISYETRGFLSPLERRTVGCDLEILDSGRPFTKYEAKRLEDEVRTKIRPPKQKEESGKEVDLRGLALYLKSLGFKTAEEIQKLLNLGEK